MDRLTREERDIVEAFERNELRPPRNKTAIMQKHREYAAAILRENRTPPAATPRPSPAGSGRAG